MDQGVLECLKKIYRKSVLKELVYQAENEMLAFLKKIGMLKAVEKIAYAWEQISPKTLRKSWPILTPLSECSDEKNAISLESVLNDGFVEQFAALNIKLAISDIDGWFHADVQVMNI